MINFLLLQFLRESFNTTYTYEFHLYVKKNERKFVFFETKGLIGGKIKINNRDTGIKCERPCYVCMAMLMRDISSDFL